MIAKGITTTVEVDGRQVRVTFDLAGPYTVAGRLAWSVQAVRAEAAA